MTRRGLIRVLIADDNAVVRDALAALIESEASLELAAAAADAAEAVELAAREQPDVALIDMNMPGGGGIAAARGIAARSPRTRMIALSASGVLPQTLELSMVDCLVKGSPPVRITDSIKRAAVDQTMPSLSLAPKPGA